MDDLDLLRRYARDGCADAFGQIVRRHIGWVYSASLRQVGDADLAEDVTQSVFVLLTRRAGTISEKVALRGWLFNTLRFVAREARRKQGRRRRHEARAAIAADDADPSTNGLDDRAWERMSPLLDEAVAALRESDRQAVLLRFYEGKSFAEVAEALGVSEVAARKRVSRAVGRLGDYFKRRGVAVPAAVLAMLMMSRSASAAPAGFAGAVTATATGAGAIGPVTLTLVRGAAARIVRARRRLAAAIVACMGLLGLGLWTLLVAWLAQGYDVPAEMPIVSASEMGDAPAVRAGSQLLEDGWELPRRPTRASARFEIAPLAPRGPQPPPAPNLSPMWWVDRWLESRDAQAQRARSGGGDAGPGQRIDPATGQPIPPAAEEVDGVESFVDLGHASGGGGGGAGAANSSPSNANAGATASSRSAGAGTDSGFGHHASVAEVVVASSTSATSTAAADTPQFVVLRGDNFSPDIVYSEGNISIGWYVSPGNVITFGNGGARRYVLVSTVKSGEDQATTGESVTLLSSGRWSADQLVRSVTEGDADSDAAGVVRGTFPHGIDWGDATQVDALKELLSRLETPERSVQVIDVAALASAAHATAAPEPGGGWLVAGVALAAAGRRWRRRRRRV